MMDETELDLCTVTVVMAVVVVLRVLVLPEALPVGVTSPSVTGQTVV
jgi:hypothetical protein